MGRGFASVVLAAVLASSAAGALLFSAPAPASGGNIKIWEAYARGWATITQVDITYDRGGFTVTLPVGYRVSISSNAPGAVVVDEPSMLMSPSPAQFAVDPGDPTTQDGALTTATISPGDSVTYSYADEWLQGFLPPPPWWCTEQFQFTHAGVDIVLGGEILPDALQNLIANPYHTSEEKNTQVDVWTYLRSHPTIVVGKTPMWKEIPGTAGQIIPVTVDATNIAVKGDNDGTEVDAHGALVSDRIPAGWSVVPGSYSVAPTDVANNSDGSKTITWTVDLPGADVNGKPLDTPTPYHGIKLRYKLESPHLPAGRIELPRAAVDTNADETVDAHSEIPIVDVFSTNQAPTAVLTGPFTEFEGSPIEFDASASSDPDGDNLQFRWDFTSDGTWDTGWMSSPVSPPVTFGDNFVGTVMVEVSDGDLTATATAEYTIQNVAPEIGSVAVTGAVEGSPASITVTFSDPGWLDTHTAFVDWGFGAMETVALTSTHDPPAAIGTFTLTHTYGDDSTYTPTIAIVDDDGGSVMQDVSVPVSNASPSIEVTTIPSGDEGAALTFEARIQDPGSDDLTVSWSGSCTGWSGPVFYPNDPATVPDPDPSPEVHPRDVTDTQTVVCGDNGGFAWSVTAADDDGGVTTVSGTFSVGNLPPFITMRSAMMSVREGTQITLSTTARDAGSDDLTFTWSWDLGPTETHIHYNDGVGPDPPNSPGGTYPFTARDESTHTYGDDCACTVRVTVADDDGGSVAYVTSLDVRNVPPTPTIEKIAQTVPGHLPSRDLFPFIPIDFTGAGLDPGSDDLTFQWDFGDGSPTVSTTSFNDGVGPDPFPSPDGTFPFAAKSQAAHSYSPGDYVVRLRATDDDGGSSTTSLPVHIVSPGDLKHEAIQRIKALKYLAIARGDKEFLKSLDKAEEEVWESLGIEDPFEPKGITVATSPDVTISKKSDHEVRLLLGPSWTPRLPSYRTLRLVWANGDITTVNLPLRWPDKDLSFTGKLRVDAWLQQFEVTSSHGKKGVTLKFHADDVSLPVALFLDGDLVAQLSFTYEMEPFWIDATHLNPKEGEEVFEEEADAAEALVCLLGTGDDGDSGSNAGVLSDDDEHGRCHDDDDDDGGGSLPPTVVCRGLDTTKWTDAETADLDKECDLIANLLVKADEILALVALGNARETPIRNPNNTDAVNQEIAKAEEELQEAYAEWGELDYEEAIEEFGDAWEHAEHAIEIANQP